MKARVAVLLLFLSLTGFAYAQADQPAATVNGEAIGSARYLSVLQSRYGERVLRDLASNVAIRQAAKAVRKASSFFAKSRERTKLLKSSSVKSRFMEDSRCFSRLYGSVSKSRRQSRSVAA